MMNREGQPSPKLEVILKKYQAPIEAKSSIKRRAGLVVARGQLPAEAVENVIIDAMSVHGGLPDWNKVPKQVGKVVNNIYRGIKCDWGSY